MLQKDGQYLDEIPSSLESALIPIQKLYERGVYPDVLARRLVCAW